MKSYLDLEEIEDTGKTKVIAVYSRRGHVRLATIRWYGPWRQYTIQPEPDTVWNDGCLREIMDKLGSLRAARR